MKHHPSPRCLTRRRRWCFRLGAVLVGLSVFAAAELVCVVFDWGRPRQFDDPFVGFGAVRPLFELNAAGDRYEIPPGRQRYFAPDSFPAQKGANTFRIFCVGGSTVQGRPYSIETSFSTWLQLALSSGDPGRQWEVVNCGGISYASYRLVAIVQEVLKHEPDLIVLCTGHNEFLESRTYDHIRNAPRLLTEAQQSAGRLRIYQLLRQAMLRLTGNGQPPPSRDRPVLKDDVDAQLDYDAGLEAYQRDDAWRDGVTAHYAFNVRRMLGMARDAGVPVMLIAPPSNLGDCPPFKSQHGEGFGGEDAREWQQLFDEARALMADDPQAAIERLELAAVIDELYAATYYVLGRCYQRLGRREDAMAVFTLARDMDICSLRMISELEAELRAAAKAFDTPLIDAQRLLEVHCPDDILGDVMLVDHVHPNFEGHQMIATALVELMAELGMAQPTPNWQAHRDAAFDRHFRSLDDEYFVQGRRELKNLQAWTRRREPGPVSGIDALP